MTRIPRLPHLLLGAALALTTVAGCSNDENPTDPGAGTGGPAAGTSYTHHGTSTLESGQVVQSREFISVITETNVSHFGRTGLVKMVSSGSPFYIHYNDKGDMSMVFYVTMNGVPVDSSWVTYPFGSGGSSTYPTTDRVVSGARVTSDGSITHAGAETLTIAGETFQTQRVRVVSNMGMGAPGEPPMMVNERIDTIWYAPTIRYFVKQSGVQLQVIAGDTLKAFNVVNLKSYSLK